MRPFYHYLLAALVGGAIAAAILHLFVLQADSGSVRSSNGYPADAKLSPAMIRALQGDMASSAEVVSQINDCATLQLQGISPGDGCSVVQRYWQVVDAENGGTMGASALYMSLAASERYADRFRALFWLDKLQSSGNHANAFKGERQRILDSTKSC